MFNYISEVSTEKYGKRKPIDCKGRQYGGEKSKFKQLLSWLVIVAPGKKFSRLEINQDS